MKTSIKVERYAGSRESGYSPTGYQVGKYSAAGQEWNCIIEITLWYFEEAVEELRITMFKCCNSELQIRRKRRQLRWPNACDHRVTAWPHLHVTNIEIFQVKAKCPAIKTD